MNFSQLICNFKDKMLEINKELEKLIPASLRDKEMETVVKMLLTGISVENIEEDLSLFLCLHGIKITQEEIELFVEVVQEFLPLFREVLHI